MMQVDVKDNIPEDAQFTMLKHYVRPLLKVQEGHLQMAFDLLSQVLYQMYGSNKVEILVNNSTIVNECVRFNTLARKCMQQVDWSIHTQYTIYRVLRKILEQTATNENFLKKLKVTREVEERDSFRIIVGKKFAELPVDNLQRTRLQNWIQKLRMYSKNKSDISLRNVMYFYISRCLPAFNLDLTEETWSIPNNPSDTLIRELCKGNQAKKKFGWLQLFMTYILEKEECILDKTLLLAHKEKKSRNPTEDDDDGSDKHRIPAVELDLLYNEAKKNLRHELIYLLLITTGMRVGGLCRIQLSHVAIITGRDIQIKQTGKSLEKGKKWFTFCFCPRVKELLYQWILTERAATESPYLFPGQGSATGYMSTGTVRNLFTKWCCQANLIGQHLHPHALRHSYAHILLESGNSAETVSKLLGHSNIATTTNFYLKESASQVASRANIPWLNVENQKDERIVPSFLTTEAPRNTVIINKKRDKKKRKIMASLDMFTTKPEQGSLKNISTDTCL